MGNSTGLWNSPFIDERWAIDEVRGVLRPSLAAERLSETLPRIRLSCRLCLAHSPFQSLIDALVHSSYTLRSVSTEGEGLSVWSHGRGPGRIFCMYYGKCFRCRGADNCIPVGSGVWSTDGDPRSEDNLESLFFDTLQVESAPGLARGKCNEREMVSRKGASWTSSPPGHLG